MKMHDYYSSQALSQLTFLDVSMTKKEGWTIEVGAILEALSDKEKILCLPSGFGELAKNLLFREKKVVGVDISQQMLVYAALKLNIFPNYSQVRANAHDLPFSEAFDGVACLGDLGVFRQPKRAMEESYRVLKPGGYFVATGTETNQLERLAVLVGEEQFRQRFGHDNIPPVLKQVMQDHAGTLADQFRREQSFPQGLEVVTDMLTRVGFNVIEGRPLYHGTTYVVVAQKP